MKRASVLTGGSVGAQNLRDASLGYRVVASEILPGRLVLGLRALLALLFALIALFMIVLAALVPRASAILIVYFFAGFECALFRPQTPPNQPPAQFEVQMRV